MIKRWLQGFAAQAKTPSCKIPRYPPFTEGIPVLTVQQVIDGQQTLIQRIRQASRLDGALFDELIVPTIYKTAGYMHLLPASEQHHHAGAGGLFRHSLEVALFSLFRNEKRLQPWSGSQQHKREADNRWQVVVLLSGLFHDIGKLMTDMEVTDLNSEHCWSATDQSLCAWAEQHGVANYVIRWQTGRHNKHHQVAVFLMARILTERLTAWLSHQGVNFIELLLAVLSPQSEDSPLKSLIQTADELSVKTDLNRLGREINEDIQGMSVDQQYYQLLQKLAVENEHWRCNVPNSPLWYVISGHQTQLLCNWARASELLAQQRHFGVSPLPHFDGEVLLMLLRQHIAFHPLSAARCKQLVTCHIGSSTDGPWYSIDDRRFISSLSLPEPCTISPSPSSPPKSASGSVDSVSPADTETDNPVSTADTGDDIPEPSLRPLTSASSTTETSSSDSVSTSDNKPVVPTDEHLAGGEQDVWPDLLKSALRFNNVIRRSDDEVLLPYPPASDAPISSHALLAALSERHWLVQTTDTPPRLVHRSDECSFLVLTPEASRRFVQAVQQQDTTPMIHHSSDPLTDSLASTASPATNCAAIPYTKSRQTEMLPEPDTAIGRHRQRQQRVREATERFISEYLKRTWPDICLTRADRLLDWQTLRQAALSQNITVGSLMKTIQEQPDFVLSQGKLTIGMNWIVRQVCAEQ